MGARSCGNEKFDYTFMFKLLLPLQFWFKP